MKIKMFMMEDVDKLDWAWTLPADQREILSMIVFESIEALEAYLNKSNK